MYQLLAIHLLEDGQNTFQLGRSGPTSLGFLQFILDGERLIKEFRGRLLQVLQIKTCLNQTDHPEAVRTMPSTFEDISGMANDGIASLMGI